MYIGGDKNKILQQLLPPEYAVKKYKDYFFANLGNNNFRKNSN